MKDAGEPPFFRTTLDLRHFSSSSSGSAVAIVGDGASINGDFWSLSAASAGVTGGLLYFLNLAERSIDHYPAAALADTLTNFLVAQENKPTALRSISAPERMAAIVQTLASREHPLSDDLRAKLFKLLDMLVELGDRRSAALLGSEWFKTARRSPPERIV